MSPIIEHNSPWREYYEDALRSFGFVAADTAKTNQREHLRFQFLKNKRVWAHANFLSFPIKDISAGGISFYSDLQITLDMEIPLSIEKSFSISGRVKYCGMELVDSVFLECKYRVGVQFLSDEDGYKAMVLLLNAFPNPQEEMELASLPAGPS